MSAPQSRPGWSKAHPKVEGPEPDVPPMAAEGRGDGGRSRRYTRHGLTAPRTKLRLRGMGALDRRTATARAVIAFRGRLEQDLGGSDNLSTQMKTATELLARETAYLDHYDAYLMGHTSVLTQNRRALVRERGAIVDRIARLLALVGLERRARDVRSYAERVLDHGADVAVLDPQVAAAEPEPGDEGPNDG